MKWYRDNWYYIGLLLFIAQAFFMLFQSCEMDMLKKLMIASFMALNLHQFEEYVLPGGFPKVFNYGFMQEKDCPECYPLNKKSAFICNVCCIYPVYILAIIFSNCHWLGLAIVIFGATQFIVHGILFNKKLGTIYNPGMASIIILFLPICIYYIHYLTVNYGVNLKEWLAALATLLFTSIGALLLPIQLCKNKKSPDRWPPEEYAKFNTLKLNSHK